ncbi:MAG TPA: copper resistance protein CopC [Candidatus Limnocylindria bacterium]|nr:copper resistance protein CopC [Candidatus Limnocylindria bacterium]
MLWLSVPQIASAHAELVSSTPAANASLRESPAQLSMTFTEPVDPTTASVQLLDENQAAVNGLGQVQAPGDATTATVALPKLDPGVYTVSYRVTSATDGHVTAGIFAFQIDPTGTQPAPTGTASSSSPSSDPATIAARWVALVAALVLFGTALFWLVSGRPAMRSAGTGDLGGRAVWAALAGLAALAVGGLAIYLTLAALPFTNAPAAEAGGHGGHPLATGPFPLDFAAPFGTTAFANAMRLALVGGGAAFLVATGRYFFADDAVRHGRRLERFAAPFLVVVAAAAAASLLGSSLAGHAASLGGPLFGAFDWLHLLAVGAWLGTLPGLMLLAWLSRPGERRACVVNALQRHSRVALVAAPIVALTGIANSPIVLGSSRDLVSSAYGNLVVAKALLFSVAVAIGSANFFLVKRGASRRTLQLAIGEILIGGLAVVVAATMVTIQPAVSRLPILSTSSIGTAHLYGSAGTATVHAAINLPSPGDQQYEVSVADAETGAYLDDVQKVFLVFTPPATSNLPSERVELKAEPAPGLWSTAGAYTPIVGDWKIDVVVRRTGQLDASAGFELPVQQPLPPQRVPPPDDGIRVPAPIAALWLILPDGAAGWLVIVGLLGVVVALGFVERQRQRSGAPRRRWLVGLRVAVVVVTLVAGLGVGSRAVVEAANQPPAAATASNPIAANLDSALRGRDVYMANCASCHGSDGDGNGPTAVGMLPAPGPLGSAVRGSSDGQLSYVITNGVSGTRMPGFATILSENDRWDLVNYLRATFHR